MTGLNYHWDDVSVCIEITAFVEEEYFTLTQRTKLSNTDKEWNKRKIETETIREATGDNGS